VPIIRFAVKLWRSFDTLLESEFSVRKRRFYRGNCDKRGIFETAPGGTVFWMKSGM
jgi:DNA-binding NtrC family response regulator